MRTKAIGDGPIVFFNDLGQQTTLPLSEIYFDGLTPWVPPSLSTARLMTRLAYLAKQGQLVPDTAPPPPAAMLVTAANSGSTGNNVWLSFTPNVAGTTVDVFVVEEDTYTLDVANIESVLGRGATPGSRPGVVKIKAAVVAGAPDPVENLSVAADVPTGAGPPPATPTWTVLGAPTGGGPAPTAFVLEPRAASRGAFTIAITDVSTTGSPKTFTLTATWRSPTVTLAAADFGDPAKVLPLGFAVTFSKLPPTAAAFLLPAQGIVHLSGGAEATTSSPATATVLAST